MAKVVESIGKTYDEALKSGLEQIGLTEDEVTIEAAPQTSVFFPGAEYEIATSDLQGSDVRILEEYYDDDLEAFVPYETPIITGTLKTVSGWTAYGTNQQDGHFLALRVTAPGAKKIEAGADNYSTLDDDGLIAIRIRNKDEQKIKVRITYYDNEDPVEKVYDISGLELEDKKSNPRLKYFQLMNPFLNLLKFV